MLYKYKKFLEADSQGNGMLDYLAASRNTNNLSNDENMKRLIKTMSDADYSADHAKTGWGMLHNAMREVIGKKSGHEAMNSAREMENRLGKELDIHDPEVFRKMKNLEDGQKRKNKAEQDAMFERIPSAIVGPSSSEIKASKAGRDARNAAEARASKAVADAKASKEAKKLEDLNNFRGPNNRETYVNDTTTNKIPNKNNSPDPNIPSAIMHPKMSASEASALAEKNKPKPKYNPKFSLNKDNLPKVKSVQQKDNSYKVPDLRTSPKNQNNTKPIENKQQDSSNQSTNYLDGVKNRFNDLSKEVQGKVQSKVDTVKSDLNNAKNELNDSLNKANKEIKDALTRTPPYVTQASKNAMGTKEAQDIKAKQSYIDNKARVEKEKAFKERLSNYQSSPQRFVDDAKRNPGKTTAVAVAALGVAGYAAYKMAQQKKWRDKGCSSLSNSVEKAKCKEYLKSKKG